MILRDISSADTFVIYVIVFGEQTLQRLKYHVKHSFSTTNQLWFVWVFCLLV